MSYKLTLILACSLVAAALVVGLSVRSAMIEQTKMQLDSAAASVESAKLVQSRAVATQVAIDERRKARQEDFRRYGKSLVLELFASYARYHELARLGMTFSSSSLNAELRTRYEDLLNRQADSWVGGDRVNAIGVPEDADMLKRAVLLAVQLHELKSALMFPEVRNRLQAGRVSDSDYRHFEGYFNEKADLNGVLPQLLALCSRIEISDRECLASIQWEILTT